MSTIEMVWEDPQPRRRPGRGGGVHAQVLAQLKKNPGRWCMVQQAKSSPSTTWWKERGCEATTRTQDDKTVKLYVRWPEPAAEAAVAAPAAEPQAETPQAPAEPEPSTPRATPEPAKKKPAAPKPRPAAPAAPAAPKPPADVVELPAPRTPSLIGQHMGDCECGRRGVLLDRELDLCILCRNRLDSAPAKEA